MIALSIPKTTVHPRKRGASLGWTGRLHCGTKELMIAPGALIGCPELRTGTEHRPQFVSSSYFCGPTMLLRLLPFLILVAGCAAPDTTGTKLIGHGGLGPGGEHPMNSEASVMSALEMGLDGVELDVQMTADGVLIAYHDLEMGGENPCIGPVHTHDWPEMKDCTHEGVAIPRLDMLLRKALAEHPHAEFTLDVKLNTRQDWNFYIQQVALVIRDLNRDPTIHGHMAVECMATDFLLHLRNFDPAIPLFYYCAEAGPGMRTALANGFQGLTMDVDLITREQAQDLKEHHLQLTVFDVSGWFSRRRAAELKPDRIQVDGGTP